MTETDAPTVFPFPIAPEDADYRLFPVCLESDDHVFFHGTAEENLASILENGFRISGGLPSVSFGKDSSLPLSYACKARSKSSPNGVVIVVRYEDLTERFIKKEAFGLHVYCFNKQPKIIGYCVVPGGYLYR
jgi:hypothetical protein